MDDLSLRVYLENGSDAMRGGWLELPVVPERLDAFMRGVVGVDDGGGYAVVDHEPGWFGDVPGSDLDEHRNVMSARVAVPADPGRGCRGSLDDAAPPMDGPAGDEGMLLFNDLAFDSGFVARMDTLASRFADDFAHGRYDAGTALRETRSLVAEAAMLMETVTGASYGAGAADCAASLALSAVTDAVNGYVDDLVDRNDCDPRVAAANHAERSADPHARPGTLPCLRMFTTAYGKTDETDVFGDGAPVEGMESSSMQLTR